MRIAALERSSLADAARVLASASRFERAGDVAEEKLFGTGPVVATDSQPPTVTELVTPRAFGMWDGSELVGVAAVAGRWLRLLAVAPDARDHGAGSLLLAACEQAVRDGGGKRLRVVDQPGNYLAPGVDERDAPTIRWLERRGFARGPDLRSNVLIEVQGNPRVSAERVEELREHAGKHGYEVRRARWDEAELLAAIAREFGGAWPFEVARALEHEPAGVHVAVKDGAYCAFAAHDGNNRGLGWFGPTGTWPAHRGQGLGEALLVACLVDVGAVHARCEVAWIGPRPFYDKVAGVAEDRRFVALAKDV